MADAVQMTIPLSPVREPGGGVVHGPVDPNLYRAGDVPVLPEPSPRTSAKWKEVRPLSLKYVDDGMTLDKLNFATATPLPPRGRLKRAAKSQNVFRAVIRRAQSMGMKVNADKTNLLVVSDALSYDPVAEIEDEEGNTVRSSKTMKILGFHMSSRPNVSAHVEALRKRFRQRYCCLLYTSDAADE